MTRSGRARPLAAGRLRVTLLACCLFGVMGFVAQVTQSGSARRVELESWRSPILGAEFLRLPPGSFGMGSPPDEPGREPGETLHEVRLTRPPWFGRTEVTQAQWRIVMGEEPSALAGCDDCPVETVSLDDVSRFLVRLAELEPAQHYRLPSEAEWEYACRAGGSEIFGNRPRLSADEANVDARYPLLGRPAERTFRGRTLPVASFAANDWGLFDMSGNVWEWTQDPYCPYPDGPALDPKPSCGSDLVVIRGGSWVFGKDSARCALRYTHRPQDDGPSLGFRLVREDPDGSRR